MIRPEPSHLEYGLGNPNGSILRDSGTTSDSTFGLPTAMLKKAPNGWRKSTIDLARRMIETMEDSAIRIKNEPVPRSTAATGNGPDGITSPANILLQPSPV